MFPSLSTACDFHIIQLMWTANHQFGYECVAYYYSFEYISEVLTFPIDTTDIVI